ncbi:MAG: phenylalanine--tRNA ligase subunit beta, partial [Ardenticatenaceae bacterium]
EYVDLDDISVSDLAERLTTAGLEVAGIEYIGVPGPVGTTHLVWNSDKIRVGEIISVRAHPNADRLRLVTVRFGEPEPKTVVTGAPNVAEGQKVAYAATGATIINGYSEAREHVTLESKKLRGILSEGMVLSERELGLSDSHEGIMELAGDAPTGNSLQSYLGDVVLDIDLTPNLGRAASIVGVAREVAALFERTLRMPPLELEGASAGYGSPVQDAVQVEIRVPAVNPRFTFTLIRDVELAPSPAWMQRRLLLAGMRPISNVVDVTNYVMLELGQPLHAFDYDKLKERANRSGAEVPTVIMRMAKEGERLVTLDKTERRLSRDDILVTDTAGILSVAGVMGGIETEVSEETTNILLEAAAWDFISVRRTAARHLLHSQAAYRFSRGVHPAMAIRGNKRAANLIAELGHGQLASGIVDAYPQPAPDVVITLDVAMVNRLLGTELALEQIAGYLERLAFGVERERDRLRVTVPDHRLDVTIPADLVEEVARVHGLDQLLLTLLDDALPPLRVDEALRVEERIRDLLVGAGLTETISYSMTTPEREARLTPSDDAVRDVSEGGYICIANPISQDRRVMRRSLLASAVETVQSNLHHRDRVAIFEIGNVYLPVDDEVLPEEALRLVIVMTGVAEPATWLAVQSRPIDYYDLKGVIDEVLEHLHLTERATFEAADHPTFQPGRVATLKIDGKNAGILGELHPGVRQNNDLPEQRIAAADLDLGALIAAVPATVTVAPIPRFPAIVQDLAAVVDEAVPARVVEETIWGAGVERLTQVQLFDVYQGKSIPEGKKSLAYSLRYVDPERTLTDEEVAGYHATITSALRQKLGAQIRGEDD